jgi:hypothetical protein
MSAICNCPSENSKNMVVMPSTSPSNQKDTSGNLQQPGNNLISAFELRKKVEQYRDAMTSDEISKCNTIISEFEKALFDGKQMGYFNVSITDKMKKNLLKLGYWCGYEVRPDGQERGWVTFA